MYPADKLTAMVVYCRRNQPVMTSSLRFSSQIIISMLIFIYSASNPGYGQSSDVFQEKLLDSILSANDDPEQQMSHAYQLCRFQRGHKSVACMKTLLRRVESSDSLTADVHCLLGKEYLRFGEVTKASKHLDTAFTIATENQIKRLQSKSIHLKGFFNYRIGNYHTALDHYYEAQKINLAENYKPAIYRTRIKIILLYFALQQYNKAREELNILKRELNTGTSPTYFFNLGKLHFYTGNPDSSFIAFNEIVKRNGPLIVNNRLRAYLSLTKGDSTAAVDHLLASIQRRDTTEVIDQSIVRFELAQLYVALKKSDKAKALLNKIIDDNERLTDYPTFSRSSALLGEVYDEERDYERAWKLKQRSTQYDSSLESIREEEVLLALEHKFKSELKEKEIVELKNQQKYIVSKNNLKNWIIGLLILGLCVLSIVSIWIARLSRSKNKIQSALQKSNLALQQSLQDKNILLKEIHHRVKNNLQIVSSLLNLQKRFIKDPVAAEAVQASKNRVKSMALVHQQLYDNEDVRAIQMRTYITKLSHSIQETFGTQAQLVTLKFDIDVLYLDIDTAIPLGLIVNELLTNSFKHGFENEIAEGVIIIEIKEKDDLLVLKIADNGVVNQGNQDDDVLQFGKKLIESLGKKLKAEIITDKNDGYQTTVVIHRYKKF